MWKAAVNVPPGGTETAGCTSRRARVPSRCSTNGGPFLETLWRPALRDRERSQIPGKRRGDRRGSNPRHLEPQPSALQADLRPPGNAADTIAATAPLSSSKRIAAAYFTTAHAFLAELAARSI